MVTSPSMGARPCRPARLVLLLAASVALLSPSAAVARTWHVPGDTSTIQAGINLAQAGDDVLVGPGTYQEHDIDMKAGIWVHSEQGADATTIDAADAGVGFSCNHLHQRATIEGFTVLNGHARGFGDQEESGGGIRSTDSAVAIRNCVIMRCIADSWGGGIYAWGSEVDIEASTVSHCSAFGGAGISTYYWPPSASVRIADCTILDNEAAESVGGMDGIATVLTIEGCVVSGNLAHWGHSGGMYCYSPSLTIRDCLVTHNTAYEYGGSMLTIYQSSGSVDRCTVANNIGVPPAGGLGVDNSTIEINRTIIAFHEHFGMDCSNSQVTVHCSDIYGNGDGDAICGDDLGGNFSADPLFCNHDDYTLDGDSPCLPGHHPDGVDCGLIGARDEGCGGPAVTGACCLSDGSCLVEREEYCGPQHGMYQGDGTTCDPNPCQPTPTKTTTWGRIKSSFR